MILDALIAEFQQRFQHEKRARVCLWFDDRGEFTPLLPALQEHLSAMPSPPFVLLEYDPGLYHGQIWLKYRVYTDLAALGPEERKRQCYVFYLPLSEDHLDTPDDDGMHHLELLTEYRLTGVLWRLGGKRPTLFSFLRHAGVKLPDNPSEQRRLYDGGRNSLLAKYVAKFVDRPSAFWTILLTPEVAQARLIGDVEQTILDLGIAPETTWQALQDKGLTDEFVDMVRERYGFKAPIEEPGLWMRMFVEVLALTETYLGYGEPVDFPFADRLPPLVLRQHHVQLLQRWLRDAESRPAWDRWIAEVESRLDLSAWAAGKQGLSFSLPHLVAQRWQRTLEAFETASEKVSATRAFFAVYRTMIQREAEFGKASHTPVGSWAVLASLDHFLDACDKAAALVEHQQTVEELVRLYIQQAPSVDRQHLQVRYAAMEQLLPTVGNVADRAYANYTNALNQRFSTLYTAQNTTDIAGLPLITTHLEQQLWHGAGQRAVVIVDALRYDCAHALQERLTSQHVQIHAVRAALPTVTPIGMTALLPLGSASIELEIEHNALHPKVNGKDTAVRANRLAFLADFGADCRDIEDLENVATRPPNLGNLLVVFGHEEVDHLGHGSADTLIRHMDREIERLAHLIRKLHHWGYPEVHVVTDHGFILLDEDRLPPEVHCEKDWCYLRKERFALVPASADIALATLPCQWNDQMRLAVPPGLAFFTAEKSFAHGGIALQEMVIPHLISRSQTPARRLGIEVVLPTFELLRTAVKVTLRPQPQGQPQTGQLPLFAESGRALRLDVYRTEPAGIRQSVLAPGRSKEVQLTASSSEVHVTLFFHTALSFQRGELLDLDIRDVATSEQFPPGGIKLTVGRDM
jgi:hypothetical protein